MLSSTPRISVDEIPHVIVVINSLDCPVNSLNIRF